MITEYMSLKTAAAKWRSKPWYISKACDEGQVPGAVKVDGVWIIPADMERPPMHINREEPKPNPIQHGSEYKDSIYRMTMRGFPDFNVITKKIGNTIYEISGIFSPDATRTVPEHVVSLALFDMGMPRRKLKSLPKKSVRIPEKTSRVMMSCGDTIWINSPRSASRRKRSPNSWQRLKSI